MVNKILSSGLLALIFTGGCQQNCNLLLDKVAMQRFWRLVELDKEISNGVKGYYSKEELEKAKAGFYKNMVIIHETGELHKKEDETDQKRKYR